MTINQQYAKKYNLLLIDDIHDKNNELKKVDNPLWADKDSGGGNGSFDIDNIPDQHGYYTIEPYTFKKFYIFKNEKICYLQSYYDSERKKPYCKKLMRYKYIDRSKFLFNHSPEYTNHGESIYFHENGKILSSSLHKNDSEIGIRTEFYDNGQIAGWAYYSNKNNSYRSTPAKKEFGFLKNGNLKFIIEYPNDSSTTIFSFIYFDKDENVQYVGRHSKHMLKQRWYWSLYFANGKNFEEDSAPSIRFDFSNPWNPPFHEFERY